jgi:hypothetical protein
VRLVAGVPIREERAIPQLLDLSRLQLGVSL